MQQFAPRWPKRSRRTVNPVGAPFVCCERAVSKDNQVIVGVGKALERLKPFPPLRIAQMIVAIDKPAPARQRAQAFLQHAVIARIRDQPQVGKGR